MRFNEIAWMTFINTNWNPTRKDLTVFSLLLIAFGAIVGFIVERRTNSVTAAMWIAGVCGAVGLLGLAFPRFIRVVYVVWMTAVSPIGFTVSTLVLAIAFFGVIWPIGAVMRLTGRDALKLKLDREAKTYWQKREQTTDPRRYFRQY